MIYICKDTSRKRGFCMVYYDNVKDGLVSSLVNYTEVISLIYLKKFSDDEELGEISIPYEFNKKRDI